MYRCRAENPLGAADHEIELEEARVPGIVNKVISRYRWTGYPGRSDTEFDIRSGVIVIPSRIFFGFL